MNHNRMTVAIGVGDKTVRLWNLPTNNFSPKATPPFHNTHDGDFGLEGIELQNFCP